MPLEPVGVFTCLLALGSLRWGLGFGIPALMATMLLQSAAAMLLPGIGTVQPAYLLLGLLCIQASRDPVLLRNMREVVRYPRPGFWLVCTWIYAIASAIFMPRLFAGDVLVNAASASDQIFGSIFVPLRPLNGNITQSVYLTGDLVCYLLLSAAARSRANHPRLVKGLMMFCILDVVFALADIATSNLGVSFVLDPIRNSTYSILSDLSVGGLTRIIGSFPEASSFAAATVSVFCISMRFWLGNIRGRLNLVLAVFSLALLIFATSTTGYVALAPCLLLLYTGSMMRIARQAATPADLIFVLVAPLMAGAALIGLLMQPGLLTIVADFLRQSVFDKGISQSGIERGMWNAQALQNAIDTHGLGVGLGSARASSIILAALSNIGVPGALLYALFFATSLARRGRIEDRAEEVLRDAARLGAAAGLISLSLSGAMVEPGLWIMTFAAIAGTGAVGLEPARTGPSLWRPGWSRAERFAS